MVVIRVHLDILMVAVENYRDNETEKRICPRDVPKDDDILGTNILLLAVMHFYLG